MKILVPVDGSPESTRAVKLAIDQVKAVAGVSLVIVTVQNFGTLGIGEGAGIMPPAWIGRKKRGWLRRRCEKLSPLAARQECPT
jgi:Universal stress protein family